MLLTPGNGSLPTAFWYCLGSSPRHPAILFYIKWHLSPKLQSPLADSRILTSFGGREAHCRYDLASSEDKKTRLDVTGSDCEPKRVSHRIWDHCNHLILTWSPDATCAPESLISLC